MNSDLPYVHCFKAMTVPCEVRLYGTGKLSHELNQLASRVEENTRRLEKKYNFYNRESWLSLQVNQRRNSSVELDEEAALVFSLLEDLVNATQGVFDPSVGTLKSIMNSQPELSYKQGFQLAQGAMGVDLWQVQNGVLFVKDKLTQFDLGGVIKEFAIDQAVEMLIESGITSALVNFGGDIRALGSKPDGTPFQIAVLNPKKPSEAYFSLPLQDAAFTTSAHYERRFRFADKETSHILAEAGTHPQVLSVSVMAPTALEAGAMSTALTIQPALPVPDQFGVIFIDNQLVIHQNTEFLVQ